MNQQVEDQVRRFLAVPDKNRLDEAKAILWLSRILKWYKQDFRDPAGSLEACVQTFLPQSSRKALASAPKVSIQ